MNDELPQGWATAPLAKIAEINPSGRSTLSGCVSGSKRCTSFSRRL
jgi:hypothetical protein